MDNTKKMEGRKKCTYSQLEQELEENSGHIKLPKEEKKARKILSQLNMIPITGFARVVMRRTDSTMIIIDHPEVYKPPNSDTYIVFGVPRCQEPLEHAQQTAAQRFKVEDFLPILPSIESMTSDSDDEDDDGVVNEADINIIISQCNVSRKKAIQAYKKHKRDLVNAIMYLTR